jgi:hypothetical protein
VKTVLDSLTSSPETPTASDMKPLVDVLNALSANLQNVHHEFTFRKFKESEIRELLRSLWFSIREELGLSTRNVFIVVISSSLILGLLLMFIFIGIATQHIRRTRKHIRVMSNLNRSFVFITVAPPQKSYNYFRCFGFRQNQ